MICTPGNTIIGRVACSSSRAGIYSLKIIISMAICLSFATALWADDSSQAVRYSTGYYLPTQKLLVTHNRQGPIGQTDAGSAVPVEPEISEYCFVLLDRVTDELLEALTEPDIRLLGIHGDRKCLIVAADGDGRARLEQTAGVIWIGMPPGQLRNGTYGFLPDSAGEGRPIPADIIDVVVHLFESDTDGKLAAALENAGLTDARPIENDRAYVGTASLDHCASIASAPYVKFVEPIRTCSANMDLSASITAADLNRTRGWTGAGIKVAVLDTGYDVNHLDLPDNVVAQNFVDGWGVSDAMGHGTHVAGIILGRGAGSSRYTGIAPGIDDIYALKILDDFGDSVGTSVEDGLQWVRNSSDRIDIANLSLGGAGLNLMGTDYLSREADYTALAGVCVVVAAGNEFERYNYQDGSVTFPGVAKNVITVGSVNDDSSSNDPYPAGADRISNFSGRGPTGDNRVKPDVVAPGSIITAPRAGDHTGYTDLAGTSMATAHVSGIIAQLLQKYPAMRNQPALIRAHLMATAQDIGQRSEDQGAGRVDAFAALTDDSNLFNNGWFQGVVSDSQTAVGAVDEYNITVPDDAVTLRVFLVWHEPPAGAGAGRAVINNLDLLVEKTPGGDNRTVSDSLYDNVESVIIDSVPAGTYRIQVTATELALGQMQQDYSLAYSIVRGTRTDQVDIDLAVPPDRIAIGETFTVSANLTTACASTAAVEAAISIPRECLIESATLQFTDGSMTEFVYDTPFVYQDVLANITAGELIADTRSCRIDWNIRAFASIAYEINVSARSVRHGGISASGFLLVGDAQPDQVLGTSPDDPIYTESLPQNLQPLCGSAPTTLFVTCGLLFCRMGSNRRRRTKS